VGEVTVVGGAEQPNPDQRHPAADHDVEGGVHDRDRRSVFSHSHSAMAINTGIAIPATANRMWKASDRAI